MRAHTYIQYISDVANLSNRIISGLDILKAWFRQCPRVLYSSAILSLRINVTYLSLFANRVTGPMSKTTVLLAGVEGIVSSWPESTESSSWLTREPNRRYSISAETRDAHTAAAKTSPWQSVRTDLTRYSWNDKTETTTSTGHRLISSPQRRRRSISLSRSLAVVSKDEISSWSLTVRKRRSLQSLPRVEWNPRRNASRV